MADQRIVIRDAGETDAPVLAELALLAGHGLMDIFYDGLVPGKTPRDLVLERRILRAGSFCQLTNWRVAEDNSGVLGGLNSFPHEVFAASDPDPLVTAERWAIVDSLSELEAEASGSYYVNMIAVLPNRRRGGVGRALMAEAERLAAAQGFATLCLSTFAADKGLLGFYLGQGYEIRGMRPIEPHPALELGGDWALMAKQLSRPGL